MVMPSDGKGRGKGWGRGKGRGRGKGKWGLIAREQMIPMLKGNLITHSKNLKHFRYLLT